jgi:hypothetical protein
MEERRIMNFGKARRMGGRVLSDKSEERTLYNITRKNIYIDGKTIDISKAKNIGIKTWGALSYMSRFLNYDVVGLEVYKKKTEKEYGGK